MRSKIARIQHEALRERNGSGDARRDYIGVATGADFDAAAEDRRPLSAEHLDATIFAIRAGRAEILRMYRAGHVSDAIMRKIEQDLDIQEIVAERRRDERVP